MKYIREMQADFRNGFRIFECNNISKWIHQNRGVVTDSCNGVLVDNLYISMKDAFAIAVEHYVNSGHSNHIIYYCDNWCNTSQSIAEIFYEMLERESQGQNDGENYY